MLYVLHVDSGSLTYTKGVLWVIEPCFFFNYLFCVRHWQSNVIIFKLIITLQLYAFVI